MFPFDAYDTVSESGAVLWLMRDRTQGMGTPDDEPLVGMET